METLPQLNSDWIINTYVLQFTAGSHEVLPFDPSRYAVTFSSATSGGIVLTLGASNTSGAGISITNALPPFSCNFRDSPGQPAGPWFATVTGASVTIYIIESIYRPEVR